METNERRAHRVPLKLSVEYEGHGKYLQDWTQNVSSRGFFVVTQEDFSIGDTLQTRISLPGGLEPVDVAARVVWRQQSEPQGVGVRVLGAAQQQSLLKLAYFAMSQRRHTPFRVVVVDDDPRMLEVYGRALDTLGERAASAVHIVTASDGQEALREINAHGADIVIADLKMPRMDGYELTRRLRKDSRFADVPVIAVTAQDWKVASPAARAAGVNDILQKPFRLGEFLELVAMMLAARVSQGSQWDEAS